MRHRKPLTMHERYVVANCDHFSRFAVAGIALSRRSRWAKADDPGCDLIPSLAQTADAFARSRLATSFSAPPATMSSCAAGLSGGKANDFRSTLKIDFA
jgi:hypothetical protein